jgi:Ser/Thr protein kinase RdoA (MazF antagonist)
MGLDLAEPDWAPLSNEEAGAVLAAYRPGSVGATVLWRSPRPMSAAGLVRAGDAGTFFIKRQHRSVRSAAQLRVEHAFAAHLRSAGQPVPAVLPLPAGGTVLRRGDYRYEVTEVAGGVDVYRDAVSWSPYLTVGHAHAAGAALARLHLAAASFACPARPPAALMDSCSVTCSPDPLAAVERLVAAGGGLGGYLRGRPWREDLARWVLPLITPAMRALPPQWGHGDWHPSNLTWTCAAPSAQVAGILDLGLANRTCAVHDLAVAIERSIVAWLDLAETGRAGTGRVRTDIAALDALLAGYQAVRPLSEPEQAALPLALPVAHVEYALSEIEYFAGIVHSARNAGLAYDYLIGHARWFTSQDGKALLAHLRMRHATRM